MNINSLGMNSVETYYKFKPDPNFNYVIEPYYSWMTDLYSVMGDETFSVKDIMGSLGLTGEEAMSLLTYMLFDCKCVKLADV